MRPPNALRASLLGGAATAGALVLLAAPASGAQRIVLGSPTFAPNGTGWGTVKPREIFNGGAPSGSARHLRWRNWGGRIARATGKMPIYRPSGGYYRRLGDVQLKAYDRSPCAPGGPRAYRRLKVRVVDKPGGRYGRWFRWSGARTICVSPFGG